MGKHKKKKGDMSGYDGEDLSKLEPSVESLIHEQIALAEEIETFRTNYKKRSLEKRTRGYITGRLAGVETCWKKFRENHCLILSDATSEDKESEYFIKNKFGNTEESYSNFIGELYDALEGLSDNHSNTSTPYTTSAKPIQRSAVDAGSCVKLPRIDIPKFSGSYSNWRSFYDLFGTLIHKNSQIAKVQKLYFLKTNLEGEALRLIRHLDIVENNYDTAWQLLINRYDNKRIIVNNLLKTLTMQSPIKHESSETLKQFLDTTNECLHSLRNFDVDIDSWDPMLIFLLVQKLPTETRELWETSLESTRELPKLNSLTAFLESRFRTLEMVKDGSNKYQSDLKNHKQKHDTRSFHVRQSSSCPMCNKPHVLRQCPQFLKLNAAARKEFVTKRFFCSNCLAISHPTQACNSPKTCYYCHQRHNTLLHEDIQHSSTFREAPLQYPTQPGPSRNLEQSEKTVTSLYVDKTAASNFLLATALVRVNSITGTHILRALIDPGSQGSFITEGTVQKLQLRKEHISARITGLSTSSAGVATSQVHLKMQSICNTNFEIDVNAFVLKSLTSFLPSQVIQSPNNWQHLKGITLADPTFCTPGRIDLLLGVDIYPHILLNGIIKGGLNCPTAQNTYLGWILFGEIRKHETNPHLSETNVVVLHNRIEVDTLLRKFWELEETSEEKVFTKEEKDCEDFFGNTHRRLIGGRYEVCLPFVHFEPPVFGKSRHAALTRLQQMERRLSADPVRYQQYSDCLKEYLELDHMRNAPTSEDDHEVTGENKYAVNYLPHHYVLKESTTTQLRVVFDASHRTTNGVSLNDTLLTGPKLQEDLISIVMRWRKHKIAFTSDITKMYRQIRVAENDLPYQRILWRNSPEENVQEYELTTVTFGTSSAPYLAIRTLRQLAEDERIRFPLAYPVVMNDFYVDDVMSGADDFPTVIKIQKQLTEMLATGGFELRKWASNCFQLIEAIPEDKRELKLPLNFEEDDIIKTLGLYWHPVKDIFSFKVSLKPTPSLLSKRVLLSEISRLFDPVGWIAPSIILAKMLIQKLWIAGVSWDDLVPENIAQDWYKLKTELRMLQDLEIPRWLGTTTSTHIQLHGFCDSSTTAYCAVVYVRSESHYGVPQVQLLASKTKVAPVKPISLPRLELCGALLLAKLIHQIKRAMKFNQVEVYAWSDSQITLSWIKSNPSRWKTFVCNRVAIIQEHVDCSRWNYVESKQNPADCGSRGLLPSNLIKHPLWWNGPHWLMYPKINWPSLNTPIQQVTKDEVKTLKVHSTQTSDELELLHRYSSLHKLVRITALCFRFSKNCQHPEIQRTKEFIKTTELRHALNHWLRVVQLVEFQQEICDLKNERPISKKSHLLCLNPFVCDNGFLRVGGRIQNSTLSYSEKHPIILPCKNHLTYLLVLQAHQMTLHGGPQLMAAYLRKTYWIINARNVLRHIAHKCVTCFRYKTQTTTQLMGNLPKPRLRISRPFTHTGIDYAGPILVRMSKGRGARCFKGYIAIFVCLCTKAIHLEAVSDQTSEAFLAAMKRFISRRGLCSHIYSDCGTNFVGADKILKKDYERAIHLSNRETAAALATQQIEWHFIPPASPHFGGLWEAAVKAMKHHLRRILGDTTLTFEELTTVLTQIEACLNSRPLCPLSNDPSDLSVLTPGHFLTGDSLLAPPESGFEDFKRHNLTRWQYLQQLYHQFWKRWSSEYVSQLQRRPKWLMKCKNLEIGNIVLIKDEQLPPRQWLLGRIVSLFPGQDGLVRVVEVKTSKGTLKRPISKISLLPTEDNQKGDEKTF